MSTISILPLRAEDVNLVAALHETELRYSFNSQLGSAHLAEIYRAMLASPGSYVGVAWDGNVPAGVVSGTLDSKALKQNILRTLGVIGRLRILWRLVLRPRALITFFAEMKPRPTVRIGDLPVRACLTTIAVASTHRRMGVAAKLAEALEIFFRTAGVAGYWLETIRGNSGALAFCRKQGFVEVETIGQTVVMLKRLA